MQIIISNQSKEPIYEQIIQQVKKLILNGELKEGDALPSMRQLAKDLQISLITTKRAYEELEKDGYIYSIVGKGSFVKEHDLEIILQKKEQVLKEKLTEAMTIAREIEMTNEELHQFLEQLLKGE